MSSNSWSVGEFYRKVHKYLKLEDSKEALHKIGMATDKKNYPGVEVEGQKG